MDEIYTDDQRIIELWHFEAIEVCSQLGVDRLHQVRTDWQWDSISAEIPRKDELRDVALRVDPLLDVFLKALVSVVQNDH